MQRGPVCYSCANPLPEGRCHNIDVCQEGEVCLKRKMNKGGQMINLHSLESFVLKRAVCYSHFIPEPYNINIFSLPTNIILQIILHFNVLCNSHELCSKVNTFFQSDLISSLPAQLLA